MGNHGHWSQAKAATREAMSIPPGSTHGTENPVPEPVLDPVPEPVLEPVPEPELEPEEPSGGGLLGGLFGGGSA